MWPGFLFFLVAYRGLMPGPVDPNAFFVWRTLNSLFLDTGNSRLLLSPIVGRNLRAITFGYGCSGAAAG